MQNTKLLLILPLSLILSACGGGSGGGDGPGPAPTEPASISASAASVYVAKGGSILITYTGHNLSKPVTVTPTETHGDSNVSFSPTDCTVSANTSCSITMAVSSTEAMNSATVASASSDASIKIDTLEFAIGTAPQSKWPAKAVVGYIQGHSYQNIQDSITKGYDVIVYAFAGQNQANTVIPNKWWPKNLITETGMIQSSGKLALLSVGGAINSFTPGTDPVAAGQAMAKTLADNGFDGIDFDLENTVPTNINDIYLINYIKALRARFATLQPAKYLYITAAPQVTGTDKSGATLQPAAIFSPTFLDNALPDAIFVQAYNQNAGAVFGTYQGSYLSANKAGKWADVGFLSAAFNELTKIIVNQKTKIIMGVPSYMNYSYLGKPGVTAQGCMDLKLADHKGLNCYGIGLTKPTDICTDIRSILNNPQVGNNPKFGGLMTWAINSEFDPNNYGFAPTKPAAAVPWPWISGIKKKGKTSNICQ
jgi:chitinase